MFNQNGYSLADIAAATGTKNNDGFFGNDGWWIILLFLFAGWGGGGFGFGNNGGAGSVREEIAYGFDMNGLENGVRGIQQGLCDGFYAMNTGMLNGFAGVNNAIVAGNYALTTQLHDMAAANAACCCENGRIVERGFADLGYALATQSCETRRTIGDATRDILENNNAGVRSILDFLTKDKIDTLTAENASLRLAASQAAQNNYLVGQLAPKAVPAYMVTNPYTGQYGVGTCAAF